MKKKDKRKKAEKLFDMPNVNQKDRPCLYCKKMFLSTGAGHRICKDCKSNKKPPGGVQQVKLNMSRVMRSTNASKWE